MKKRKFYYCGRCKEDSMIIKKVVKGGYIERTQICINKGCGRAFKLPIIKRED